MGKSLFKSKTFWVNLLTLSAGTLGYWAGHDLLQNQEQLLAGIVAVQGAVNIALRLVTSEPIE